MGDRSFDFFFWWLFFRQVKPVKNSRPAILVINHVFEQDLEALQIANTTFSFIVLSAFVLRNTATRLFPTSVESYHAYNDPAMDKTKLRWRKIMDRFVQRLVQRYNIRAVIAPSDNFFYVRELITALHKIHIPYYVIDKEGTICPAYFTHFAQYIHDQCPLIADHVLVWSERQKQFWMKTGVPENKITITGQPRSDFWRQQNRWLAKDKLGIPHLRPEAPLYLFFTYDPWAYTPDYMVAKGEMHWEQLRQETHATLFEFARQHPGIDLVIKAHPQQLDLAEIRSDITSTGLTNIHFASGSELSNQLIVNADCVIGFQTTALIEAMITDKPIIYTFWGEAKDRWSADLIPFHQTPGVQTITSPEALNAALADCQRTTGISSEQRRARDAFVAEYFSMVDGQASSRTINTLSHLLGLHQ